MAGWGEPFFDVPVYRVPRDRYEAQQKKHVESQIEEYFQDRYVKEMFTKNPNMLEREKERLAEQYGGIWRFNEIIGFIRLHFLGTQIRGEWWRVKAKVIRRSRKKVFESRDHKVVYEEEIPRGSTDAEIYELILHYLERAQRDERLKRFHIDSSVLKRIGPYVKWGELLKETNKPRAS